MDNFNLKKYLAENKLLKETIDSNEMDDIPSIQIDLIDDGTEDSPEAFFKMSAMYHSGNNGKMDILKNNPVLAKSVIALLQKEFQKTFREVIHGTLGEPFGLDENKLNEGEINFIPQFGKDHQIVFYNAKDAYTKLAKSDLDFGDFENIGFVFPKMSRNTWLTIKDLFSSEDIGDMGQI